MTRRQKPCLVVCEQQRVRPACASAQFDHRSLENAIYKFAINKISIIQLVFIAKQADFMFTWSQTPNTGPEVIKLFPCSTRLRTKFILLINVKMPTIVGILTFISMINTTYERLRASNLSTFQGFSFYDELKVHAQFS